MTCLIQQLLTHLGQSQTNFETIHDLIWDHYITADPVPNKEVQIIHRRICNALAGLSFQDADGILCLTSQLTCEYEKAALREGVRIGTAIVGELSHS